MLNSVIFSGPQGSGKSYIARAMKWALDYEHTSCIKTATEIENFKDGKTKDQLLKKYSLIIIDECTEKNISDLNEVFSNITTEGKCTIFYLTQDKVSKLPGEKFWLINLKLYN